MWGGGILIFEKKTKNVSPKFENTSLLFDEVLVVLYDERMCERIIELIKDGTSKNERTILN